MSVRPGLKREEDTEAKLSGLSIKGAEILASRDMPFRSLAEYSMPMSLRVITTWAIGKSTDKGSDPWGVSVFSLA